MANSRLQNEHPFPGDTVPKYRYKTLWLSYDLGMVAGPVSAGAGSMALAELTTGSVGALNFDEATDSHAMVTAVPPDADVNAPIDFRILWSSDQTTVADSYTWTLKYREVALNSTVDLDTAPATDLDTTIAADTNLVTANAVQYTAWGTIDGGTLTGADPDYLLHLLIDPASIGGTISDDVLLLYAVQIRYQPKTM